MTRPNPFIIFLIKFPADFYREVLMLPSTKDPIVQTQDSPICGKALVRDWFDHSK